MENFDRESQLMKLEKLTQIITPDEFQKKRNTMLDYHMEVEQQFFEVLRTIPLENHATVFSPKLYNILQNSCVQVENMLRLLCDKFELHNERRKFPIYYKLLYNILRDQCITLIKPQGSIYPFKITDNSESPFWWTDYNKSKHELPEGFRQGNLGNATYALGASYAVHCMAYFAQNASEQFLDSSRWDNLPVSYNSDGELIRYSYPPLPKSDLFYYSSRYVEMGAPT